MNATPWCRALDPERFVIAWHKAQEMALVVAPPLVTHRPGVKADDSALRWLVACRQEFPDQTEAMSCSMRFFGITVLAEKGLLGPFYSPQHGIWTDALRVLARARCHVTNGYIEQDVRERLDGLDPPPAV